MSPILLLFLVALARAQYLVEETEGCVTINVTLPGPYTVLRIDQTDYLFDGEYGDGTYVGTARVCDVEDHIWAGFRMDEYMKDQRFAYVTVYFSQGGQFTNIEKNCIQPDLSSPAEIDAAGESEVTIACARQNECARGLYTTIMTANADLCRDYSAPKCKSKVEGDVRTESVTFRRPRGEDKSFVFCSTLDSFLSYVINWGGECGGADGGGGGGGSGDGECEAEDEVDGKVEFEKSHEGEGWEGVWR
ncbi:unnamed protein product [Rodentolepis nana]|uniref:PRKCSH_1 domain-containing protein n=1 Tax=Rodentolepis nana TaxID=102285 RepID=A0A0R3TNJ5_RODNA|nr:unnamed protein product [Rodentolepis nana]